jgi:hypothetical protein
MRKLWPAILLALATCLVVAAIVVAERAVLSSEEIPDLVFFGIPFAGAAIALFAIHRSRAAQTATPAGRRRVQIHLGVAVALAILPMALLTSRYRGDYDPMSGRVAPDGSPVTSVSWREDGGRYIELLNNRHEVELTEAQYREIMRRHQRAFLGVIVVFASLAFWTSLANVLLELKRTKDGSANTRHGVTG